MTDQLIAEVREEMESSSDSDRDSDGDLKKKEKRQTGAFADKELKKSLASKKSRSKSIVLNDTDLGNCTEDEKELLNYTWDDFKQDVGLKTLLSRLDKAIKRRQKLIVYKDAEE